MKRKLITPLIVLVFLSCNNDCKIEERTLASGEKRIDANPDSPFFGQTVLDFYYTWLAEVESGEVCKNSTCIEILTMKVANLSPKDMDLTITLAGKGDFAFSINKGDTVLVAPLPDFCLNNSWGTVKEIKYK